MGVANHTPTILYRTFTKKKKATKTRCEEDLEVDVAEAVVDFIIAMAPNFHHR
jgi:hypothetical protein